MQNKGAIRLLIVVLAIACAYQLSFTFVTRHAEKKAKQYAANFDPQMQEAKERFFLDSIKAEKIYLGFTYKQCKEKEINLGLDLKGGMNVMLEISVEDVVRALANNSKDPIFNQALEKARNDEKNSTEDYISLFAKAYAELSNNAPLAYIFNTPELKAQDITANSSNDFVIKVIREQADGAIANSFNVLRNRIDRFGVTQPNIQRLENSGRILVELPGVKEPERVRKLLQGTASLEFWATYENSEIYPYLAQANELIRELNKAKEAVEGEAPQGTDVAANAAAVAEEITETPIADSAKVEGEGLLAEIAKDTTATGLSAAAQEEMYPLFSKLSPMADQTGRMGSGPVIGSALAIDTAKVNAYLNIPQVKALFPRDLKLMWDVKAVDKAETIFQLYAIKANTRDGKAPLDGGCIIDAKEEYAQRGAAAEVNMGMNSVGARTWARLTADNIGRSIAIVLDGYVYSAPRVNNEITGGRSNITGGFTINEARDLANVLKSGKLPAPARITQEAVVGPSLGAESISAGMISFIVAFILVLLYMQLYYNKAGRVANVALIFNLFLLFGVLVSFGAVLTLPGIAGIVLTIGMAVDANVLIYERVKEELRQGKGLSLAVNDGFKNAYSAIIDGQLTTLITGIVLFIFGTGPVQGFATTLIIGIITSLFCAIFIPRLMFVTMIEKGKNITFSNKYTENFLYNTKIDFIKLRKTSYIIASALVIIVIGSLLTRGLNYGVEFSGGRSYVVRFDQMVDDTKVREALNKAFVSEDGATESFVVMQFGNANLNQMRIVTQYKFDDASEDASSEVEGLLYKALSPFYTYPITLESFRTTQTDPNGIISADKVGPSIANDIKVNSLIALLFSLLAIGIYIMIRFKKWEWGMSSVISLGFDALMTVGLFSLFYGVLPFNLEVDQSFIAAILTVIGYSINDKVIVFDRIREYRRIHPKRRLRDNINGAINSTLARTVNTGGTTLVTVLAIFLFGGEVIRGFIFALIFGIIIGTLSSIFIATPIAYDMIRRKTNEDKLTGEDA